MPGISMLESDRKPIRKEGKDRNKKMKFYLAPLEGITGYVYRKAYQDFFHDVEKYFIPFVEPHRKRDFNAKERKEISRETNRSFYTVPQILTNCAEDFLRTAQALTEEGYDEINLNLGCPSGTVVSKGKGAGFLEFPDQLDRFLDTVCTQAPCAVSVKTRIGRYEAEEFGRLLEIYEQYPLKELIVHPRTREDYYKNIPDWNTFSLALEQQKFPVCYNGDLFSVEDYQKFCKNFPQVDAVMLGRGIIRNPLLVSQIRAQENDQESKEANGSRKTVPKEVRKEGAAIAWECLREFHDRLYQDYQETLSGDRPVLFKMKELWCYQLDLFPDSDKIGKKLKKAQKRGEYEQAVEELFRTVCR